jgi:hypothetical protein
LKLGSERCGDKKGSITSQFAYSVRPGAYRAKAGKLGVTCLLDEQLKPFDIQKLDLSFVILIKCSAMISNKLKDVEKCKFINKLL